jgi:endonuclease III
VKGSVQVVYSSLSLPAIELQLDQPRTGRDIRSKISPGDKRGNKSIAGKSHDLRFHVQGPLIIASSTRGSEGNSGQDRMRTSRISQETTRIFSALSPNARATRTRGAKSLASFALGYDGTAEVKEEHATVEEEPSTAVSDIEDALTPPSSRKRKRGVDSPASKKDIKPLRVSPRKIKTEEVETSVTITPELADVVSSPERARQPAKPKVTARRATSPNGTVTFKPPSNWEEIYDTIKAMRERNPTAPVDTMGCEDLFFATAPPAEKRYHTLTALMLSSQTKDTVTAAAMQRLHTELVPQKPDANSQFQSSTLTIQNILDCDPKHLDSLIGKVGFHNNKTKFIKAVASILAEQYNFDIPSTIPDLVSLPGVGPKMAYLCMSAAWGIDEGIGVDVHVHRITNLWGWHSTKTPEETRMWLEGWLPRDRWHHINKMLVGLGQTVCLPVGRRCGKCDLAGTGLCKAEIRGWKAKEKIKRVKKEESLKVEVEEAEVEMKVEDIV